MGAKYGHSVEVRHNCLVFFLIKKINKNATICLKNDSWFQIEFSRCNFGSRTIFLLFNRLTI